MNENTVYAPGGAAVTGGRHRIRARIRGHRAVPSTPR